MRVAEELIPVSPTPSRAALLGTRWVGRLFLTSKCDVAHGLLERAERQHVFGRTAGDEAGAVAEAADVDR